MSFFDNTVCIFTEWIFEECHKHLSLQELLKERIFWVFCCFSCDVLSQVLEINFPLHNLLHYIKSITFFWLGDILSLGLAGIFLRILLLIVSWIFRHIYLQAAFWSSLGTMITLLLPITFCDCSCKLVLLFLDITW